MEKIYIRLATESEIDKIDDFLIHQFNPDNPFQQAYIHQEEPENIDKCRTFLSEAICNDHMLLAIETTTESLVGVLVACLVDSKLELKPPPFETRNKTYKDITNFLEYIKEKANVCKRFNVNQSFHIEIVGVHRNYRNQKIARKLFESGIDLAKSENYELVSVDCTNIYSSRIAENLGMERVSTVTYDEYNKYLGECLFVPVPLHIKIETFVKKL